MLLPGMVGFAEGVISESLMIMCIGLSLLTVCAAFGLSERSRVAAVVGLLLVAATAYLFQPWGAFIDEPWDDPDVQGLYTAYLWQARWWVLASVAAMAGTVRAFWRRRVDALALRDLSAVDLERCPVWRYEGLSDDTASVSPAPGFKQPDREIGKGS
jgi:hypothetical protein